MIVLLAVGLGVLFLTSCYHVLLNLVVVEGLVLIIYLRLVERVIVSGVSGERVLIVFVCRVSAAGVGLRLLNPLIRRHGVGHFIHLNVL